MKTQTSVYLSDKDIKKLKELKSLYEADSVSELLRIIINNEYDLMAKYKELIR